MMMKLNTFKSLPKNVGVAFSGGIDSAVLLHLARSLNKKVTLLTFDHRTETSAAEVLFAKQTAEKYNLEYIIGRSDSEMEVGDSKERFWSEQRYSWFHSLDMPVLTGHHLNDVGEWYLMTAASGHGGYLMNYANRNVIRPLLIIPKASVVAYARENNVDYLIDPTNTDVNFNKRNKVRAELLPCALSIYPGLLNALKRRVIEKERNLCPSI
jgi:tRNA(Ile)-lysidine synthase